MIRWTDTSCFGSLRSYAVYDDTLTVLCHDVSSYVISTDVEQCVISVDPIGWPRFYVGQCVEHGGYTWTIQSIMFHYRNKSTAVFVFAV